MSVAENLPSLLVSHEDVGDVAVVRCVGEIDLATLPHLRDRIARLQIDGPPRLVVDATAVTFIDSLGLGALIGAHKRARVLRGSLAIVPSDTVRRVFAATALDRVFELHPSVEDALAARP